MTNKGAAANLPPSHLTVNAPGPATRTWRRQAPDTIDAVERLGISCNGLLGLIRIGAVTMKQVTDFAPWSIAKVEHVQNLVRVLESSCRLPPTGGCPDEEMKIF